MTKSRIAAVATLAAFSLLITACSGNSTSGARSQSADSTASQAATEKITVNDPEKDQPVSYMTGSAAEKTEYANLTEAWANAPAERFGCVPVYTNIDWPASGGRNEQENAAVQTVADLGGNASLGDLYTACALPDFGIQNLATEPADSSLIKLSGAVKLCPNNPDAAAANDYLAAHPIEASAN